MAVLTCAQFLDTVREGWGAYVTRFRRLAPEAQAAFLDQQGYARLADLLAHVVAWWREGLRAIPSLVADPGFSSPDYDVDAFNAVAVANARDLDESAVIAAFELACQAWLTLIAGLPADAFEAPRIVNRLHIELIGHLEEHAIQ